MGFKETCKCIIYFSFTNNVQIFIFPRIMKVSSELSPDMFTERMI